MSFCAWSRAPWLENFRTDVFASALSISLFPRHAQRPTVNRPRSCLEMMPSLESRWQGSSLEMGLLHGAVGAGVLFRIAVGLTKRSISDF